MKSDSDKTLFKNILKLISGEGIGRAVGFLMTPVITRLYTPTDFGMLAVFASVCALCYPFCTLRYTLVIPLHTNEKIGINSLAACILISIGSVIPAKTEVKAAGISKAEVCLFLFFFAVA